MLTIAVAGKTPAEAYTEALEKTGRWQGTEVRISWFCPEDGTLPETGVFDGLMLSGGGDIDPAFYGQACAGSVTPDPVLDRFQFGILDDFLKAGKPVFGICRGMQLLNVYFGGTMIQDLPDRERHTRCEDGTFRVHRIIAEPDSLPGSLYGTEFPVNSSHHQGAGRIGRDLRITARCGDVVEALAHTAAPVFGVQFHPERMDFSSARPDTVRGRDLFGAFFRLCSGRSPRL